MTVAQFNARAAARSGSSAAGVTHIRHRHREKFTVVGNHLAQHQGLSACAIGIGVYIQSLPDGVVVSIRALTARFPEGERRIGQALNELEAAGYLERVVHRVAGARVVTSTRWYEHPGQRQAPKPEPAAEPQAAPVVRRPEPPLPDALRPAARLLAQLRQREPRLVLSEQDVRRLAPLVGEWLERGLGDGVVSRILSGDLPQGTIRWPGRLVEHRLRAWLPPRIAAVELPLPLQNCDRCDRAFRAARPGVCGGCQASVTPSPEPPAPS
ncbi:helix-turn-helix domain-containing protein [Streptomyces coeruleoprunus]|uniref:Helix-turn-helix domain-containing protein n=1 Tax=Streptomyces coeruleoprunus TaxID=285563 RepID=A0ABV9XBP2_9ACTN